jgi:hypothetical protein
MQNFGWSVSWLVGNVHWDLLRMSISHIEADVVLELTALQCGVDHHDAGENLV